MSSKLVSSESKIFSEICVQAILAVWTSNDSYPIKNINLVKSHGRSILDS